MSRAEKIRQMDDSQLADYICDLMPDKCEQCRFGERIGETYGCRLFGYLREEVGDESNSAE